MHNRDHALKLIDEQSPILRNWLFLAHCCLQGKPENEKARIIEEFSKSCAKMICGKNSDLYQHLYLSLQKGLQYQDENFFGWLKESICVRAHINTQSTTESLLTLINITNELAKFNYNLTIIKQNKIYQTIQHFLLLKTQRNIPLNRVTKHIYEEKKIEPSARLKKQISESPFWSKLFEWAKLQDNHFNQVKLEIKKNHVRKNSYRVFFQIFFPVIAFLYFRNTILDYIPQFVFDLSTSTLMSSIVVLSAAFVYCVKLSIENYIEYDKQVKASQYVNNAHYVFQNHNAKMLKNFRIEISDLPTIQTPQQKHISCQISLTHKVNKEKVELIDEHHPLSKPKKEKKVQAKTTDSLEKGKTATINTNEDTIAIASTGEITRTIRSKNKTTILTLDPNTIPAPREQIDNFVRVFRENTVGGRSHARVKFFKNPHDKKTMVAEIKTSSNSRIWGVGEMNDGVSKFNFTHYVCNPKH